MNGDICLFLLTQVFLIIHQSKLVTPLAKFLLGNNFSENYQVTKLLDLKKPIYMIVLFLLIRFFYFEGLS